jgi:hypothetical protein
MTGARRLLAELRDRGLYFSLDGERLLARPSQLLTQEIREALAAQKSELVAELRREAHITGLLNEMRSHLSPALQAIDDEGLLFLAQWELGVVLNHTVRSAGDKARRSREAPSRDRAENI